MPEIIDLIPGTDVTPAVPSRVVVVHLAGPTEGPLTTRERTVTFRLVGDIHANSYVIGAGYTVVAKNGDRVRLPCFDGATGEWAIEVKKSWAPHPYAVRIPVGDAAISLANLKPVVTLPGVLAKYAISGAGISIVQGTTWDAKVTLAGGLLGFELTVPKADSLTVTALHRGGRNADWDALTQPSDTGLWTFASTSTEPRPNGGWGGTLTVWANGSSGTYQILTDAKTGRQWSRVRYGAVWTPWEPMGGGGSPTMDAALANRALEQDFRRRVGPVTVTAKSAVALRFDHGLTNFSDKILPILRQHGFRSTVAMNARRWDVPENSGVTPAEADEWSDVEFANHSASHTDASGLSALTDEIVAGRDELQVQLPKHKIDGWVMPGVGGTMFDGLNAGSIPEAWGGTAGQLILGHHAWASGHMLGSLARPLDGELRIGLYHRVYETMPLAEFQQAVNRAITSGTGLSLMMHPRQLDQPGYITTDIFGQMMAWLKSRVDAGDVQVVTLGELYIAERAATSLPAPISWTTLTHPLITGGTAEICRIGDTAWLNLYRATWDAAALTGEYLTFADLIPPDMRPTRILHLDMPSAGATEPTGAVRVDSTGALIVYSVGSTTRLTGTIHWPLL